VKQRRTETLRITSHAKARCSERGVPPEILNALRSHATDFLGHHGAHHRIHLRIVRQGDTIWIGPHSNGDLITVYAIHRSELRQWANQYLINPTQNWHRLILLPNLRTAKDQITAELMDLWAIDA
jgi:hypothetical protein